MTAAKPEEVKVVFKPTKIKTYLETEDALTVSVKKEADLIFKAAQAALPKKEEPPKVAVTYTKADVRKMFDIVYKRKPEEAVKDDEFKYFVDGIKTIEEGKEPMNVEEINKRFISYAAEIHHTPTEDEVKKNARDDYEKLKKDSEAAFLEIKAP
jgi:hypothetical protein